MRGLMPAGFDTPRPIQAETIPACLDGRDVLGLAQTGTGKTAAFALPLLDRILRDPRRGHRALILAPTRELAAQIDAEIRLLARYTKIRTVTIFGGVPARSQIRTLRQDPEIIVGCPGRVLDLIGQRALDPSGIDTLVLDEADHMFDMGFLPDIKRILATLPKRRQNLLFSATMPKAIRGLAENVLSNPHRVELTRSRPNEQIEHFLYPIDEDRKRALLERVLSADDCESAIVFTRTKHRAKRMARTLGDAGHRAVALQGNMSQSQRDRAMKGFREGRYDVLVATDIAARGIDVAGIDYVVNFDVPSTPEAYTHRIGRTGRSEETGKACTFVTHDDHGFVRATERLLDARIPLREIEGLTANPARPSGGSARPSAGGRRPARSNGGARKPRAGQGARRPRRRKASGSKSARAR